MEVEREYILKTINSAHKNVRYSIDSPRAGVVFGKNVEYLKFAGWLYATDGSPPSFVFSHCPGYKAAPNNSRPDVQKVHENAPVYCGVVCPVELNSDFRIGIEYQGSIVWVAQVQATVIKVIQGRQNHLFLGNDANDSVKQFKGEKLIDRENIKRWREYLLKLSEISVSQNIKPAFLIAPGKEYIYPEFFPETKGFVTPLEQFIINFSDAIHIVNPTDVLNIEKEFSYFKTDTHWTEYGASLAAELFCGEVGVEFHRPEVIYSIENKIGDLGSKLYPPKKENNLAVKNKDMLKKHQVFDNNVEVRGNIIVYANLESTNDQTLVVFGDSFSRSMTDFLSHSFSRVVRVFSGADIDWGIIEYEKPDHILIELTSRFLVRSPNLDFSINEEIRRKYMLSNVSLDEYISKLTDGESPANRYYVRKCLDVANHVKAVLNCSNTQPQIR
jgi:alginate O-acetyltransferase complex protein AlgJ